MADNSNNNNNIIAIFDSKEIYEEKKSELNPNTIVFIKEDTTVRIEKRDYGI